MNGYSVVSVVLVNDNLIVSVLVNSISMKVNISSVLNIVSVLCGVIWLLVIGCFVVCVICGLSLWLV